MGERMVLALEGSTATCSTALLRMRQTTGVGNESRWMVVAQRREADGRGQARFLLPMIDEMLEESGALPRELGAVVVGIGPGTFTGVRITVATARALSLALSLPVLGVSTLAALTAGAALALPGGSPSDAGMGVTSTSASEAPIRGAWANLVVPTVDAHRGQVFYGLYWAATPGGACDRARWVRTTEFGVCDRGRLGEVVTAANVVCTESRARRESGARACRSLVLGQSVAIVSDLPEGVGFQSIDLGAESLLMGQGLLGEPGSLPQGARLTPWLVKALAFVGGTTAPRPVVGGVGTPESVTPVYVRAPDADVHITKMRDPWADGVGNR